MMTCPGDLRLGDWREVLADVGEVDALICDPPYSATTHQGHNTSGQLTGSGNPTVRRTLQYAGWDDGDVSGFVEAWEPRVRGWFVALTDSRLWDAWRKALEGSGRYVFHPIPCVMRGMTVRLSGDGPSSWAVYAIVARRRSREKWGTLPGAYTTPPNFSSSIVGGKPLALMRAIIRDYTRPGDLVCDPCSGYATTGVAALGLGRRFVGAEIDPETHAKGLARLNGNVQLELLG